MVRNPIMAVLLFLAVKVFEKLSTFAAVAKPFCYLFQVQSFSKFDNAKFSLWDVFFHFTIYG